MENPLGISTRKRIKIANSVHQNISYSKNGLHTSTSIKIGNVTINSSKNGLRGFVNLSSLLLGTRYITNKPKKKSKDTTTINQIVEQEPVVEMTSIEVPTIKVAKQKPMMPPPPAEKDPITIVISDDPAKEALKRINAFITSNGNK